MLLTKLWSQPETFQPLEFRPGVNIILANTTNQSRTVGSGSRNGSGKSTFARIVDFCLLDPNYKDSILSDPAFEPYTFFLGFSHGGSNFTIARSIKSPNNVTFTKGTGPSQVYTVGELRDRLGELVFGLNSDTSGINFRMLLSYMIRREREGFNDVFRPTAMSVPAWQATTLYIMGLDAHFPLRLAELRKAQEVEQATRRALEGHLAGKGQAQPIEISLELQRARAELEERQRDLAAYRVQEEYTHLTSEAATLSKRIKRIANDQYVAQRRIQEYRDLLSKPGVVAADVEAAIEVFHDLQVYMPDQVKRNLEEVARFQKAIIDNRKKFLDEEITILEDRVRRSHWEIEELDEQRRRIMAVLGAQGQLEEYDALAAALSTLRERIVQLESYEAIHTDIARHGHRILELEAKATRLAAEGNLHLLKNREKVFLFAGLFSSFYFDLYGHQATLDVKMDKEFTFAVTGLGRELESSGRYRMAIFCYDLATMVHNRLRNPFAHWVLHDGIFNGVDSDIVASALQLASSLPGDLQYICTLNSDNVPYGYDLTPYVLREIADAPPQSTFLGVSF